MPFVFLKLSGYKANSSHLKKDKLITSGPEHEYQHGVERFGIEYRDLKDYTIC
jgi:hypothetical protein